MRWTGLKYKINKYGITLYFASKGYLASRKRLGLAVLVSLVMWPGGNVENTRLPDKMFPCFWVSISKPSLGHCSNAIDIKMTLNIDSPAYKFK